MYKLLKWIYELGRQQGIRDEQAAAEDRENQKRFMEMIEKVEV